mmetsp:Transcript_153982/g.271908  ORF Transcript_153982/g.271908 Transcript_153982/m.271908 type:complete len:186 (+) Transcript_153982:48-605(+)
MVLSVFLLSGEAIEAELEEATQVEDLRDRVASALLCPRKHIRLVAGDLILEDGMDVSLLPSNTITAVPLDSQLDLSRLELKDEFTPVKETSVCPIDCNRANLCGICDHRGGVSHRSRLLYDAKLIWEFTTCKCQGRENADGREHAATLSENKRILNVTRTVCSLDKQLPAVALNVADLMKKAKLL